MPGDTGPWRIRRILHDRVTEDVTLDELACAASLSRAYLVRSFTRAFGVPPHRYLMHLRVARARGMLDRGERPVAVAYDCGFYDQSHLNRWFRRVVGVTPGEYAASASPMVGTPGTPPEEHRRDRRGHE
jgi:transcriptional regulator GlxA family with amidase domain